MRDPYKRAVRPHNSSGVYTPYVEEKEAYENLANAIIITAVIDYTKARKRYRRAKTKKARLETYAMMDDCLRFFRSKWFGILTDLDPEVLIKRLREETDDT